TRRFNFTAYEEYSPLYLPISFATTYMVGFASPLALITQTLLYYWPAIHRIIRRDRKKIDTEQDDIHAKLMRRYPEVSLWYYLALSVICLALSTGVPFVQPSLNIPLSAILLSIALAGLFVVPQAFLQSMTGQRAALNLIAQIIPSALWPERPMANMGSEVFKFYLLSTVNAALAGVVALKFGHYMKVPPRYSFIALLIACITTTVIPIGVVDLIFAGVDDVCESGQAARLNCYRVQGIYTSSIVWGLIGPNRQFGKRGVYYGSVFALIAGALLPVVIWCCTRLCQRPKWLRSVNFAVALNGLAAIPPATGINYTSWFGVGFLF
ncbi:hypothetical protein FRB90_008327, partial [Tulasnella sp. 427]